METNAVTALISIKEKTDGLFTGGKGYTQFIGTDIQWNNIMKEFKQNKHLFLNPIDKSACHFLAENKEYRQPERYDTLAQIVSNLLGYERQEAWDNGDKEVEGELLKDVVIWQYMNQYARKVAVETYLEL
ncbi:hypothetical protein ACQJ0K_10390 [Priestia megaterium]|uniref:hypothetical protein n=1 Tax=Priestia megaterium TaxID=1404 RepID=UPI003CEAE065